MPKRVFKGVTYNTDTATLIAQAEDDQDFNRYTGDPARSRLLQLYQTRGGAFFLYIYTETMRQNAEGEFRDIVHQDFEPLTESEARHWVTDGRGFQVEILNDVFGEPPEAEAEEIPGATLYVRLPASLKDRIEAASTEEKLSANAWAMRCMEQCLKRRGTLSVVPQPAHKLITGLDTEITLAGRTTTIREQWLLDKASVARVVLDLEKENPFSSEEFYISATDLQTLWGGGQD